MLLALFWFFSIPAVVASLASLRAGRRHLQAVTAGMKSDPHDWTPPVTLIVPVKGIDEDLRDNLRSLVEQDYPDFELLVAVRDPRDPAVGEIRALLDNRARLVVARSSREDTGEKINNLLAAVAEARPSSQVLAFADSDGRVERHWLRALVSPLRDPSVGAATGYRWYFPEQPGWWSLLCTVWNSTVAGTFGAGDPHFAWGCAMAIRRETFETARVRQFWVGAVSDDYRLTHAVRAAGLDIHYTPRAMVATPGDFSAPAFLSWAVRQMIITRVYNPRLWWSGFAAHLMYCGAMASGVAAIAAGTLWAVPILLLAVLPGMWRGELRRQAARVMFPGRAGWLDRYGWIYSWLVAPTTWLWLHIFIASSWRRRIEWRGYTYELLGPSRSRCVSSPAV